MYTHVCIYLYTAVHIYIYIYIRVLLLLIIRVPYIDQILTNIDKILTKSDKNTPFSKGACLNNKKKAPAAACKAVSGAWVYQSI